MIINADTFVQNTLRAFGNGLRFIQSIRDNVSLNTAEQRLLKTDKKQHHIQL